MIAAETRFRSRNRWRWTTVLVLACILSGFGCSQPGEDDALRRATFQNVTMHPFQVDCGNGDRASSVVNLHRAEAGGHMWYTSGFPDGDQFLSDHIYVGTLSVGTPIAESGTKQGIFQSEGRSGTVYRDRELFKCTNGAPSWPH